jgi:adenosylmethionine-8-amino-7-oxononanoate aminotransferase
MTTEATSSRTQDYVARAQKHLWVHNKQESTLSREGELPILERGEGIYLWDVEGRRYIDGLSGLWVTAVGHGREELGEVAKEQMAKLQYVSSFDFATPPAVDLAEKLASLTPDGIERFYFVNSGSEAVEMAIKMAKQYHFNRGDKKRYKTISRIGSYHGQTAGALSVNAANYTSRVPFEPLMPGALHVPGINCYRCPYEKTYPDCTVFCARTIEDRILFEKPETIACIIAEPISNANGNQVPPQQYWQILRDLCDKYGIILIADEVINGFGRTGKWFGIENFGITPDLMTVAKGLSSGYIPIGAVMAHRRVADAFLGGKDEQFSSGLTFGTHPVSTAVALRNVEIIERERLVENSATLGKHLGELLQDVVARHRVIGEARGIGLYWALEIVKDKATREQFSPADDVGARLTQKFRNRGLMTRAGNLIYIAPPLVINREEVGTIVEIIDESLTELEGEL